MMHHTPFTVELGLQKPNTLTHPKTTCPFCSYQTLRETNEIIREKNNLLLIKNKYPVMPESDPYVIVESPFCDENMATYSLSYLAELLQFSLEAKRLLRHRYENVSLFKNHGKHSGGSLAHAHMQVIGWRNIPNQVAPGFQIQKEDIIAQTPSVTWQLSTKPKNEFYEFRIIGKKTNLDLHQMATYLQKTIRYILSTLNPTHQSFNLFFYENETELLITIYSRGPHVSAAVSALQLGFNIIQTPSDIPIHIQNLQD